VSLLQGGNREAGPAYHGSFRHFSPIRLGIDRHHRLLRTSAGPVAFPYCRNLVWDGRECVTGDKPAALRDLSRFSRYRGFLDATLERLAENLTAPARPRPLQWLGTISSGYDSPAVAVLARPFGLRDVLSFERSGPTGSDSGVAIAHGLGLRPILLQRDAWRSK